MLPDGPVFRYRQKQVRRVLGGYPLRSVFVAFEHSYPDISTVQLYVQSFSGSAQTRAPTHPGPLPPCNSSPDRPSVLPSLSTSNTLISLSPAHDTIVGVFVLGRYLAENIFARCPVAMVSTSFIGCGDTVLLDSASLAQIQIRVSSEPESKVVPSSDHDKAFTQPR